MKNEDKIKEQLANEVTDLKKRIAELEASKTDSNCAEEVLRKSGKRFRSLVEITSDWLWEIDMDSIYTYTSPKVKDILGYELREVIGKTPFEFMPAYEAERVSGLFRKILESRKPIVGLENINLHKDGRQVVLETSGVPIFDSSGNFLGYRGIDRDITERKRSEELLEASESKFRTLFENAGGAMFIGNAETGEVLDCNKQAEKLIGRRRDKIIGMHQSELHPQGEADRYKKRFAQHVKKDHAVDYEGEVQHRDGRRIPVWIGAKTMQIGSKKMIVGVFVDISERKKALEELKQHQQKLEVSERSIKEFSRKILSVREEEKKNLSHSLHDELGCMSITLRSNLFLLKEEIKDNHLQKAMDRVNQTENALVQSVEKLKAIYKDLKPLDLDIVGLPNALRQYFSDTRKQTKMKIGFRENIDEQKIDDEAAIVLYRVTQEAINNILKHARAKKVKAGLYSKENNITLIISDDGRGFDVEKRLPKTKGLGIRGMTERVASLGGTLIIKSSVQKGTEIRTTIPAKQQRGV